MADRTLAQFHGFVTGRVQGVGFRWFVIQQARKLNLNGWTRNLHDGRVEVLAEGPKQDLDTLIDYLYQGPSYSIVRSVDVDWSEPDGLVNGFDVKY